MNLAVKAHRQRLILGKFTNILHDTEFELNLFLFFFFFCVCVVEKKEKKFYPQVKYRRKIYLQYDDGHNYTPQNDTLFSSLLSNSLRTAVNFMKM